LVNSHGGFDRNSAQMIVQQRLLYRRSACITIHAWRRAQRRLLPLSERRSADERTRDASAIYGCSVTDPRWDLLQEMKPALLQAFRDWGVTRIEYVSAFPSQDDAWVWLGTATDAERDALAGSDPQVLSEVRLIAERHGFLAEKVSGVTVQSEETVARDFEGSWFYALR
jgi:hypothetical protein